MEFNIVAACAWLCQLFKNLENLLDEDRNTVVLHRVTNIALIYELLKGNNVFTDSGYKLK